MKQNQIVVPVVIIALSIVIASAFIAFGLFNVTATDRTVTVRGLSEHEYDADFAVWPMKFSVSGNDLAVVRDDITNKLNIVSAYLDRFGFAEDEITIKEASVTDALSNYYSANDAPFRYIAEITVFVRSSNVEVVKTALASSLDLIGQGIALRNEYDSQVQYLFTKLNDVKPQMIAEATENAREAAEQFAIDSGSEVGKIVSASQGLFSIEDASPGLPEKKIVRVVTTVEYFLKD